MWQKRESERNDAYMSQKNTVIKYQKPNRMINALYDSNILDSKILAYALLKISLKDYSVIDNVAIEVEFKKNELCEMLNLNDDSRIYSKLGASAKRMLQKHAIEYDAEKKRFMGFVLFDSAYFDNGMDVLVCQLGNMVDVTLRYGLIRNFSIAV